MSDEKRKNARLQGRFSDGPHKTHKDKPKRLSDPHHDAPSSSGSSRNKKSETKNLQGAEGFSVKYEKDANIPFQQYEEKMKPVEISSKGEHVLSTTENGKSSIIFEPDFIPPDEAEELFTILHSSTQWYDKNIVIHGQEVPQPRLVAWYGPHPYAYSGATLEAAEMPSYVIAIKKEAESFLRDQGIEGVELNSVLLNLYRDGKDSVAWHSDDELSLGVDPTIVSVSLGSIRKFEMRMKPHARESAKDQTPTEYFINLTPGSVLVMTGSMQQDWKHQVPKEYHDRGPRINLTFRTVQKVDKNSSKVPSKHVEKQTPISTTSTSNREKEEPVFDSASFPPLGATNSKTESKTDKIPSGSLSKAESVSEIPSSSASASETLKSAWHTAENTDAATSAFPAENGNSLVSGPTDISPSRDEHYDVMSDPWTSDNEHELDSSEHGQSEDVETNPRELNANTTSQSLLSGEVNPRKSELNANAPDFVPKSVSLTSEPAFPWEKNLEKLTIVKLAEMFNYGKVPREQYDEFSRVLQGKIDRHWKLFSDRDHYEIDVLLSINDGNQTPKNQRLILERLCSLVLNGYRIQHRNSAAPPYRSQQQNRTVYREGGNRQSSRGSYKGSSYSSRGRNYRD